MDQLIQTIVFYTLSIAVYALPLLFAITLHEAAHAYAARLFGDPTAYEAGRVSLDPMRHIDPVGTVLVPAAMFLSTHFVGGTGFLFGWAKPVPVNFGRLRNPKRDMLWVALAGPAANLAMALIWALLSRVYLTIGTRESLVFDMTQVGVSMNLMLMAVNLLPVPPLDGGRIVFSLLPNRLAWYYGRIEPYGMMIVVLVLVTGALGVLLEPFLAFGHMVVDWLL